MGSSYIVRGPIDNSKLKDVSFAELLYNSLRSKQQSDVLLVSNFLIFPIKNVYEAQRLSCYFISRLLLYLLNYLNLVKYVYWHNGIKTDIFSFLQKFIGLKIYIDKVSEKSICIFWTVDYAYKSMQKKNIERTF